MTEPLRRQLLRFCDRQLQRRPLRDVWLLLAPADADLSGPSPSSAYRWLIGALATLAAVPDDAAVVVAVPPPSQHDTAAAVSAELQYHADRLGARALLVQGDAGAEQVSHSP